MKNYWLDRIEAKNDHLEATTWELHRLAMLLNQKKAIEYLKAIAQAAKNKEDK